MRETTFLISIVAILMGLSQAAPANTAYTVRNARTGQDTYEVVVKDETTKSDLKPGIYKIDPRSGKHVLIIAGEVLGANRGFNGILAQGDFSNGMSSTNDAIAIVNNKVVLFNHNSDAKNPDSIIVLGSKKYPAMDVILGIPVEMDPITKIEDVSVFLGEIYYGSDKHAAGLMPAVISVNSPHKLGTGVTMAFCLEAPTSQKSKPGILGERAEVINYQFMAEEQMGRLVDEENPTYVYSHSVLRNLVKKSELSAENPLAKAWVAQIERFLTYLDSPNTKRTGKELESLKKGVPVFDLTDGQLEVYDYPAETVMKDPLIIQLFDPLLDKWEIHLTDGDLYTKKVGNSSLSFINYEYINNTLLAEGELDRNSDGNGFRFYPGYSPDSDIPEEFLFIISDKPMFVLRNSAGKLSTIVIENMGELASIRKMEFVHRVLKNEEDQKNYHYIVASTLTATNARMVELFILAEENGKLVFRTKRKLMDATYLSAKELSLRLAEDNQDHRLLFDAVNSSNGPGDYQRSLDKSENGVRTTPYQDLTAIVDNKSRQVYLEAQEEISIIPPFLTFKEFNPKGSAAIQTGFYVLADEKDESKTKLIQIGRPVFKNPGLKSSPQILEMATIEDRTFASRANLDLALIPYTANPHKTFDPSEKFKLGFVLTPPSNMAEIKSQFYPVDIPYPLSSLAGARIVQGTRTKTNEFTVLLFFGKGGNDKKNFRGILSMHGQIKWETSGGAPTFIMTWSPLNILERETISPNSLKMRLKADAEGSYYWVESPDTDTNSSAFRIRKLSDPTKLIYPNRSDQKVTLRKQEVYEPNAGPGSSLFGFWTVAYRSDLFSRDSGLEEIVKKMKDKAKELKKGIKEKGKDKEVKEVTAFEAFLESLADPANNVGKPRKHQVLLVEPKLRDQFRNQMMYQLAEGEGYFSLSSEKGRKFDFYMFDETSTKSEMRKELSNVANNRERVPLLYVDAQRLLSQEGLVEDETDKKDKAKARKKDNAEEDEDLGDESADDEERERVKASRVLLLASEGKATTYSALNKIKDEKNDVPMVILATPEEWRQLQDENPGDYENGVFDRFEMNYNFLTSSWTQWGPNTEGATKEMKAMSKMPVSREEQKVFPTLENILVEAAEGKAKGKERILIIPDELKPLINRLIMSRWASLNKETAGMWNFSNRQLSLFRINGARDENTQDVVMDNFDAMKGSAQNHNVVLLGDLDTIMRIGRPFSMVGSFQLKDPASNSQSNLFSESQVSEPKKVELTDEQKEEINAYGQSLNDIKARLRDAPDEDKDDIRQELADETENYNAYMAEIAADTDALSVDASRSAAVPHLMWWIAAEGQEIQPKRRNWSIKDHKTNQISTILVGTETELNQIESDMAFEAKFFNMREHYEIVRLQAPSETLKLELISALFFRPEIKSLEYAFKLDQLPYEDARRQLMAHFVNRIDQIAYQEHIESTAAFIRAFSELRRSLVEDISLRRSRTIDKSYLERLFSRVFPMAINMDTLEAGDPLLRLNKVQDAAMALQKSGYHGPLELKTRVIENVMGQTRGSDAGRPIPNSQIFYGGTSSGKTFLFRQLVKMLDLKPYDFSKLNNEEAETIIIKVQDLTEEDTGDPTKMTVKQAIEYVQDLIAQPRGNRAWILFDDAHKCASAKIQQELFSFIQSMFEAENGMIRVKRRGTNQVREVPVQNLNLFMTVNPTANRDMIERFADKDSDDVKKLVLAALSRDNYSLEESFLARWSDVINIDKFPRAAKVPALVERIRDSSKSAPQIVLVEPQAVDLLVERYPDANAREFLSPAAAAMTAVPPTAEKHLLYLVSPKKEVFDSSAKGTEGFLSSTDLNRSIRNLTQIDPIKPNDPYGQLKLISFVFHGFRTQIFNYMVMQAMSSNSLALDIAGLANVNTRNFVAALTTHVIGHPTVPMSELTIRAEHFEHFSLVMLRELLNLQKAQKPKDPYFPIELNVRDVGPDFNPDTFLAGNSLPDVVVRTRRDVMESYVKRVEHILSNSLTLYMRLPNADAMSKASMWGDGDLRNWFNVLSDKEPVEEFKKFATDMVGLYIQFQNDMYDPDLYEMKPDNRRKPVVMTLYDQARLFSYVVDKALLRMPWGVVAKLTTDVSTMTADLSLGQKPAFINFAFEHNLSPFAIAPTDFLSQASESLGLKESELEEMDGPGFLKVCESILGQSVQK